MADLNGAGVLTEGQHDQLDDLLVDVANALINKTLDVTSFKVTMAHLIGAVDVRNAAEIATYLNGGVESFKS